MHCAPALPHSQHRQRKSREFLPPTTGHPRATTVTTSTTTSAMRCVPQGLHSRAAVFIEGFPIGRILARQLRFTRTSLPLLPSHHPMPTLPKPDTFWMILLPS